MSRFGAIERTELLEKLELIRDESDFLTVRDYLLRQAAHSLDTELMEALLEAGAHPDSGEPFQSLLLFLQHEYQVAHTLQGEKVVAAMRLLLDHGADPNLVVMNNLRVYDYAVAQEQSDIIRLLAQYGAEPEPREPI